jgi:HAE1 family hydrophobic/amphiphilic exporter-1
MNSFEAARAATAEIGLAVMATTFSLVVIFVPVAFMSSVSGRFLYQFGLTAAVAVLVSLLVSFTLTPMMSARMLRAEDAAPGSEESLSRQGFYAWIDRHYERMLRWSMAHRVAVMMFAGLVVLSSIPLYTLVQQEYIPSNVDEAEFEVNVTAPQGTSLASIDEIMRAVENELRAIPLVRLMLCDAGGGFISGVGTGGCYVRIAPHVERVFSFTRLWRATIRGQPWGAFRNTSQRDVMQQVRAGLRKFTDLRTSVRNLPSFNIGGGNWDIDFVLRGPNLQTLAAYGEELRIRSQKLGIIDADTTLKLDNPELRVVIDRKRAADLNVDTEHIASALRLMVGGDEKVSRFIDPSVNEQYDVQLRLSQPDREDIATITRLYVPRAGAGLVPLGRQGWLQPLLPDDA